MCLLNSKNNEKYIQKHGKNRNRSFQNKAILRIKTKRLYICFIWLYDHIVNFLLEKQLFFSEKQV